MVIRIRFSFLFLVFFALLGQGLAQMSWSNVAEITDYKKNLKEYLKSADKKKEDGVLLAKIGECYYMLNQMKQAKTYFEKAVVKNGLNGDFKLAYAKTLMALQDYPAARQWFTHYSVDNNQVGTHYIAQLDKLEILDKIAPIYEVVNIKQNSSQAEMVVSIVGSDTYFLQNHSSKGKSIQKILADGSLQKINVGQDLDEISYFSYAGNGQLVCFTKQQTFLGQRLIPEAGLNDELFVATVTPSGEWVNPVKFAYNKSGFNCSYPSLSNDGTMMYFSSDRADGFGGQDIYLSIKDGEGWSFPVNAGAGVNTPGNEITPYVTSESLYFSSNWNVGFGGYDIYRAAKVNGSFSKVFHQGKTVNSSRDDFGYVVNEKSNRGYFISNRATGNGLEDIYQTSKPDQNFVINVKDAVDHNNVSRAALDLSACGGSQTFTDENGQFVFQMVSDKGCRIRIEKPGYEITFIEVSRLKGRDYTVLLESNFPTVNGQVLDQNNGRGLHDVKVAVENMATKEVENLVTDLNGSFSCKLISGYTYQIQYFKKGYQSNSKTVNTGTRVSKDVIGSILLMPGQPAIATAPTNPNTNPNPAPAPRTNPKPSPTYSTTQRATNTPTTSAPPAYNAGQTKSGYAVQLAAIRPSQAIDLNTYSRKVAAIGDVYVKEGSDYNRVRVGVFSTKAEAESAKSKIRSAGYGSAYIVQEEGATIKSGPEELFTSRSSSPAQVYKIRLAALKNTGNVDRDLLNSYGKLESTQSNGLTIFYLAGFSNLSDAQRVLENVKTQGYPTAYVMHSINGVLKKLN